MAYRASTSDFVRGGDRWDRDRFTYERDRYGDERERFEERDRTVVRGPGGRSRESEVDERYERRSSRPYDDDHVRDRRYYEDDYRSRRSSPPPEFERKVFIEKEREYRSPSPPRRPGTLLRRQSSLDTFDRRPLPKFYERDEYGPPARRGDYRPEYRPEPYQPIPLPRSRALPPPRVYAERDLDEIRIAEPERYGNDDFHSYPERVREKEVTRTRRRRDRSGSTSSHTTRRSHKSRHTHHSSHRSSSRSSSTSRSSSSSGTTTVTVKSEYPKKGKTRIPGRLVSKRALIDLGYPFEEEGNTVIVQKALGQENIDDLLKLSEDYKKSELEVLDARSQPGNIVEERRTEIITMPPAPPPAPATVIVPPTPAPPPAPVYVQAPAPPPPPAEVFEETTRVVREASPVRSYRSYSTSASSRTPIVYEAAPREYSEQVAVGPLAIVGDRRRDRDIKAEIRALEAERELIRREKHHHHHHHHSHSPGRELVRAERLSTGELVLYEETVEKVEEPRRGVRIEKDKKGPPPGIMKAMLATLT
ncbi:hypothetical protein G7054_g6124 [Neopestalotiopsis clavispora]|nr:hypothetical protein E8E14_013744 [Neopestalotiopsis sp. 37M]KAF7534575.1 hypothetical protein G7054_g6124 [Neopestalotiopsis clavispora]